jgi:N-acetylneuraminic acid mutarotase
MLRPALLILLTGLCLSADAQTGQWTWMGGSSAVGQSGMYGTLRTPDAGNIPGGRYGAANWTDNSGNFWLFGGQGYDANGAVGYLNDLWEFNPSTSEWAWMSGSDTVGGHGGQPGVYGTLGTPAPQNTPGSRNFAATWTDSNGNLWLFGGQGYDVNSIAGPLNDLWKFNLLTNEWAWMSGSSTVGPNDGQSGVYGALGTPAAGNTPGGLYAPSSWTDSNGNLWLFGGQGYDANGNFHELNSVWKFDPSTTEWTWVGGSKTVGSNGDVPGVYGTLGTPAAGNIPGNRSDASSWSSGGLWLFGGNGYDSGGNGGNLNDLWVYDPATGEWAWMSGSSTVGGNDAQPGTYGTLGALAAGNTPGGRSNATSWTDAGGNLWLLGGYGADANGDGGYLNDLWMFNPASDDWAWMSGSSTVGSNGGQSGVYGTLGTAAAGNVPGARNGANGWTDSSGNLWLFGGKGYDAGGTLGYLNDLWKFPPATATLSAAIPSCSPPAGTYTSTQSVTISDATPGAILYYTTNGTTPTTSSTPYTGAITIASTETLEAIAAAGGYANSAVATAVYTINLLAAAKPTFSPAAGTYASVQSVAILDATTGAIIYFTTNGTAPTTASAIYSGPIAVASTETILAIAAASGYNNSAVATAVYDINLPAAATPTFSPSAGTYSSAQSVTLSDATTGAILYYTTNGTTPTTASAVYSGPIAVASTETLEAFAAASGYSNSAVASALYTFNLPAASPTFSPVAGTYTSAQSVSISDSIAGAAIYYTTNGIAPTTSSTPYTGAITVASTETLEAIATASGYSTSAVATALYTINLPTATPAFSPVAGTYASSQSVTLSDSTPGATIYYTTNGTTPTTSSTAYTGAITVSSTETLEAIATASGYSTSAVATALYTINLAAATPAFSPVAGTYTSAQSVTLSDSTAGAAIYYTTNGITPTTSSTPYAGAITVASTETLEAIAAASGHTNSAVATAVYTINLAAAAAPTFSPAAGTYASAQSVTLSDATAGAILYYTTNGTTPTTSSSVYAGPITVASTETIQAIAAASGYNNSAVATAVYTISLLPAAVTPAFSPAAGTYASAQSVTLSDATAGAILYYTTNGTTPTTASAVYAGPITVASTETIQAMAAASVYNNSAVAIAVYTIGMLQPAAAPAFSPPAGTYASAQNVALSDATTGAIIYYTTNGTTPTTASAVYTVPITVPSTETIQAIAATSSYNNSAVATAVYTIGLPGAAYTIDGTAVTLAPGAVTGNASTITITPNGGFTGAVGLTVAVTASPVAAQNTPILSFGSTSPVEITGAGAVTATLTVFTTPDSGAALTYPVQPAGRGYIPGAAALGCLLLCCVPARRRWRTMLAMGSLFAILASGAVACAPSITRNAIIANPGTTPGVYTLTVTGKSGATAETGTITVTVQ